MKLSEEIDLLGRGKTSVFLSVDNWLIPFAKKIEQLEQERDKYKELWEKCDKCLNNEFDKNVREKFARDGMKACVEGAVKDADTWKKACEMILYAHSTTSPWVDNLSGSE